MQTTTIEQKKAESLFYAYYKYIPKRLAAIFLQKLRITGSERHVVGSG